MSGQWEVVGKSKKKQIAERVKTETKKVEEKDRKDKNILPLSQVQSLYDPLSKDLNDKKKSGKENDAKDKAPRKSQKKSRAKKKDASKDKPLLPKNLDIAMKLINKKELYSELEMGRAGFPDTPLVWLKGLVGYLNTRLTVEYVHPVFEGKPHEYPQSILPGDLRDALKRYVLDVNEVISQALFEWCLTAMANDISREDKTGEAVLGYKLIAQLLAFHNPFLGVTAIPKVKTLLASYCNRQSIGLSLLWIVGQSGYRDLGVGLRVWHEVMFPLIDLRLYSTYVVGYLRSLLKLRPCPKPLQADYLIPTLNVLCSPPESVPTNKRKELQEMSSMVMARVLDLPYESAHLHLFPRLLKLLCDSAPVRLQHELQSFLLVSLLADSRSRLVWLEIYPSLRPQSRLLLSHIGRSWDRVPRKTYTQLKRMLVGFQAANRTLEKQKVSDVYIQSCELLTEELLSRMATGRTRASASASASAPSVSGFPWMRANLLLLAAIGALLAYDVRRHGSLRDSSTGHFLNDLGLLPHVEDGWSQTRSYIHSSFRWLQENGPEYYQRASEISRPYLLIGQELLLTGASYILAGCKTVYAYGEEKLPLVLKWTETWLPGVRDRSLEIGIQVWEQGKIYTIAGSNALIGYGQEAVTWARTKVFVGSWSPDNLQQYSLAVLNATQHYAFGTYDWLYQKVQTYSKVE